jgi:hypothetical protein
MRLHSLRQQGHTANAAIPWRHDQEEYSRFKPCFSSVILPTYEPGQECDTFLAGLRTSLLNLPLPCADKMGEHGTKGGNTCRDR